MGGKISLGICIVASILLYNKQPHIFFWIAITISIVNFLSLGAMRSFFIRSRGNVDVVPDWISAVNMVSTFVGIVLLVYALVMIFQGK